MADLNHSATELNRQPIDPTTWLEALRKTDPELFAELYRRLVREGKAEISPAYLGPVPESAGLALESLKLEAPTETVAAEGRVIGVVPETIVMRGRPAFLVQGDAITFDSLLEEEAGKVVTDRLKNCRGVVEPLLPLIGRIDVANFPVSGMKYVGTGWLIDKNLVVTNRHVAQLVGEAGTDGFVFRRDPFGQNLAVSIDYRHEFEIDKHEVCAVERIVWIEPDGTGPDIALLAVSRTADGSRQPYVELASVDPAVGSQVAVIGYPARAPASIIPDQDWMSRIYRDTYDIKRIAPGQIMDPDRGFARHDCTTLGGSSGSVVLDVATGKAVALHFAGEYMKANFAVPASVLRTYARGRPATIGGKKAAPVEAVSTSVMPADDRSSVRTDLPGDDGGATTPGSVTFTIPLTVTLSLGNPTNPVVFNVGGVTRAPPAVAIVEAARLFEQRYRGGGVLRAFAGYALDNGVLSDRSVIAVAASPERIEAIRTSLPKIFEGYPVDVRPASIKDQVGAESPFVTESAMTIAYDDSARTGPGFSFEPIVEPMDLTLHVGPDRGWSQLKSFLGDGKTFVSSIYQFHAKHIADAIGARLADQAALQLVAAPETRDGGSPPPAGDFPREATFSHWKDEFGANFQRIFVPIGSHGLVRKAYHIKVTVKDFDWVWLSSGNWTRTSQPEIPLAAANDPGMVSHAGNREWHVIARSRTLAERLRNHIKQDFTTSQALGAVPETLAFDPLVYVQDFVEEAIALEAAPSRVFEPRTVSGKIKLRPLLTPDKGGAVYCDAVLDLIRSAKRQLLFQNQYIDVSPASSGLFERLVTALIDKAREIDDVRIILRTGTELRANVEELKRRGLDVGRKVRRLANTHTKGIVVDAQHVLIGSQNWSSLGVTLNRDASLLIEHPDASRYFAEVFEVDWNRALSPVFSEAPVRFVAKRLSEIADE